MKFLKHVSCCLFLIVMLVACNSSSSDPVPLPIVTPPSHIIANSEGGLYIKELSGSSWTLVENTSGKVYNGLTQLKDGTLIASVKNVTVRAASESIMLSNDMGKTWIEAGATSANSTFGSFINFADNSILACGSNGIWGSEDGAKSWKDVSPSSNGSCSNLLNISDSGVITYFADKIWRSADNGKTWTSVFSLATPFVGTFKEISGDVILSTGYSAGSENKILKSADFGKTWSEVQTPALLTQYERLSDDAILALGGGKLYTSANKGDTWSAVTFTGVTTLNSFIVLANGDLLASSEGGIAKSADKGATWTLTDKRWTSPTDYASFQLVNGEVYAVYNKTGAGSEILKLSAQNSTWGNELAIKESIKGFLPTGGSGASVMPEPIPTPTPSPTPKPEYTHLLMTTSGPSASMAKLYIKGINEESWTILDNNADNKTWHSFAQLKDGTLLSSVEIKSVPPTTRKEIRRSEDFGETWTSAEIPDDNATFEEFIQLSDSTVLAAGGKGILRSEDSGRTWTQTSVTEPISSIHKFSDESVIVFIRESLWSGAGIIDTSIIMRTSDSGKTWSEVFNEEGVSAESSSRAELGNGVFLARVSNSVGVGDPTYTSYILKSSDYGKTWKKISTDATFDAFVRLSDGKIIGKASTWSQSITSSFFTSADNGETWKKIYEGAAATSGIRLDLVVFSNDDLLSAVVGSPSVFTSNDQGVTWIPTGSVLGCMSGGGMCGNEVELVFNDTVYVTTADNTPMTAGLWKSTDHGNTWIKDAHVNQTVRNIIPIVKLQ